MAKSVSTVLVILTVLLCVPSILSAASLSLDDLAEFLEEGYQLESTPEESFPVETEEAPITTTPPPQPDVTDRTFAPISSQAANISRSRLTYVQASGVPTSVRQPRSRSITIKVTLSGSVNFDGVLADHIETQIEHIVANSSSRLRHFFSREKELLQDRAGDGYFFFFQAAANFGYSASKNATRIIHSTEFERFTNESAAVLSSCNERSLKANFSVPLELVPTGEARRLTLRPFLYISKVTLTSGKVLNVIANPSQLVIADQYGNIYDESHQLELSGTDASASTSNAM